MQQSILHIRQKLSAIYPDYEIKAIQRILLTDVFHVSHTDYYMGKDIKFSAEQRQTLEKILNRLGNHEPLQYILGNTQFCGHTYQVNSSVLIPRPETAELVGLIVAENPQQGLQILDAGTGSGCIAIELALQMEQARVTGWDISETALQTARTNAEMLHAHVTFEQQDILQADIQAESLDILVSNPPYITECEKAHMENNVLLWEPAQALFVPDEQPLLFYKAIARLGLKGLRPGGKLYFEINRAYGPSTTQLLRDIGYTDVKLMRDLSGNDRMIKALL